MAASWIAAENDSHIVVEADKILADASWTGKHAKSKVHFCEYLGNKNVHLQEADQNRI